MARVDKKKAAKWALVVTSFTGIPLILTAVYLSNSYQPSEHGVFTILGIVLFLPAYLFSVFGQLASLIAIIILEPPWLFLITYLARLTYLSIVIK